MNWTEEGNYYASDAFPGVRFYRRMCGRDMSTVEYELVLSGKSPTFEFESSKKPGTFFPAQLRLDRETGKVRYHFPDEAPRKPSAKPFRPHFPAMPPRGSPPPRPIASKPTPSIQDEIASLRACLQVPGLHNLHTVLVPYRLIAPNNPTLKEDPHLVAVGILELAIAEELTAERAQEIAAVVQPRARGLLGLAERLQTKAYVIVMSPTNAHFWVYNLTDRGTWEKKTTQTMPGFLSLLRRNS